MVLLQNMIANFGDLRRRRRLFGVLFVQFMSLHMTGRVALLIRLCANFTHLE